MTDLAPRPTTDLRIAPPLFARAWAVVFGIVWVAVLTSFVVSADTGQVRVVAPLLMVFGLAICGRNLIQGVRSDGDDLVVRGPFRTQRVARSQIADVTVGETNGFPALPRLVVTTRDHRSLGAPPLATVPFGERARRRTEDQLAQVRAWAGLGPASRSDPGLRPTG